MPRSTTLFAAAANISRHSSITASASGHSCSGATSPKPVTSNNLPSHSHFYRPTRPLLPRSSFQAVKLTLPSEVHQRHAQPVGDIPCCNGTLSCRQTLISGEQPHPPVAPAITQGGVERRIGHAHPINILKKIKTCSHTGMTRDFITRTFIKLGQMTRQLAKIDRLIIQAETEPAALNPFPLHRKEILPPLRIRIVTENIARVLKMNCARVRAMKNSLQAVQAETEPAALNLFPLLRKEILLPLRIRIVTENIARVLKMNCARVRAMKNSLQAVQAETEPAALNLFPLLRKEILLPLRIRIVTENIARVLNGKFVSLAIRTSRKLNKHCVKSGIR